MTIDLRLGDYRTVLADVDAVDLLCVDAPYSERTHSGHDTGTADANRTSRARGRPMADGRLEQGAARRAINYAAWTEADVHAFTADWSRRVRGWFVTITDHVLAPFWEAALNDAGRYVFSPLSCMDPGSRVRLTGDGPAQWSVFAVVARPTSSEFFKWGALPGGYVVPPGQRESHSVRSTNVVGGKTLWLMRSIVRDYSRPGDLVCDPTCGGGTTLLAAAIEGRRSVGAEIDPAHYEIARKRIARGFTPSLFHDHAPEPEQLKLAGEP
jgi:site-specific DNA-methyltransferase (adenine-specific)